MCFGFFDDEFGRSFSDDVAEEQVDRSVVVDESILGGDGTPSNRFNSADISRNIFRRALGSEEERSFSFLAKSSIRLNDLRHLGHNDFLELPQTNFVVDNDRIVGFQSMDHW